MIRQREDAEGDTSSDGWTTRASEHAEKVVCIYFRTPNLKSRALVLLRQSRKHYNFVLLSETNTRQAISSAPSATI
jgi:hypothetical protein